MACSDGWVTDAKSKIGLYCKSHSSIAIQLLREKEAFTNSNLKENADCVLACLCFK
jgi:hypothetical protein